MLICSFCFRVRGGHETQSWEDAHGSLRSYQDVLFGQYPAYVASQVRFTALESDKLKEVRWSQYLHIHSSRSCLRLVDIRCKQRLQPKKASKWKGLCQSYLYMQTNFHNFRDLNQRAGARAYQEGQEADTKLRQTEETIFCGHRYRRESHQRAI